MGPRKQFFNDWYASETEHANASTYVIYVIGFIVFVIFVFVAKSAYNTKKELNRLQERQETRNQLQDQVQPATNANDNQAMQHE